jgi:hypothetical protein
MDEFKLLSENAFVPIEREEHKHICQLNENMTFELKETPEGGIQYVLIRNILKHPDDFVTFVKRHPAYGGKLKTYIPGFRQFFSTSFGLLYIRKQQAKIQAFGTGHHVQTSAILVW